VLKGYCGEPEMQRKVTVCWDADNPVLGKWACTADDGAGGKRAWTVVIREEGGKLAGTMTGDNGDLRMPDHL
jgi:hypothetical protein